MQRLSVEKSFASEPDKSISAIAQQGVQGQVKPLPYQDRLQAAFGDHDLSQIQTYSGPSAKANVYTSLATQEILTESVMMGQKHWLLIKRFVY